MDGNSRPATAAFAYPALASRLTLSGQSKTSEIVSGEDLPEVFQQHDVGFFELGLYVKQRSAIRSDG